MRLGFKVAIRLSRLSPDLRVARFGRGSDLSSDEARTRLGRGRGKDRARESLTAPRLCETLNLSGESVSQTLGP